ncbi:MAG: transposase [Bacteroidales bacterium]|nr:transposase [Bacteroidales bacterium]
MNNYNPNIHHRHSIRLKGYDYSQAGLYFITICVQDRLCLFGEIVGVEMGLNDAGKIADECWLKISKHFPNAVLHEYIIMPNHVHGIIELIKTVSQYESVAPVGVENFQPLQMQHQSPKNDYQKIIPHSIGSIVRGYKTGVTKWFRNNTVGVENIQPQPLWQRNFYEHIIRDEKSYHRISEYIINNPSNWQNDKLYNK